MRWLVCELLTDRLFGSCTLFVTSLQSPSSAVLGANVASKYWCCEKDTMPISLACPVTQRTVNRALCERVVLVETLTTRRQHKSMLR